MDTLHRITEGANPLHDYHDNYEPTTGKVDTGEGKKPPHYDAVDEPQTHANRLLLFAECQIGKTGAIESRHARIGPVPPWGVPQYFLSARSAFQRYSPGTRDALTSTPFCMARPGPPPRM